MKSLPHLIAGWIFVSSAGFAAPLLPAWISESAEEFLAGADVDGDGRPDVLIVDKTTGAILLANQSPTAEFDFSAPYPSGIAEVTGASVGTLAGGASGLALTSPSANQTRLLNLADLPLTNSAETVHIPAIGPHQVILIDIAGPGNTEAEDLVITSIWNGTDPNRLTQVRNTNGPPYPILQESPLPIRLENAQKVRLTEDGPDLVAGFGRGEVDTFLAFHPAGNSLSNVVTHGKFPQETEFAYGYFAETSNAQILFYRPGDPGLAVHGISAAPAEGLEFGVAREYEFEVPVVRIVTLSDGVESKLLVLFEGGQAAVYSFDGTNAPVMEQEMPLPDGFTAENAVALGLNPFLSGPPGSNGAGKQYAFFTRQNGQYVLSDHGQIPSVGLASGSGNVFEFRHEPFVNPLPILLRSQKAGDWTSSAESAGGNLSVVQENFGGTEQGLGNASETVLGPVHPNAQHAVPNQYREEISLFSFSPPASDPVAEVSILPPPGSYPRSIRVTLAADRSGVQVRYQVNGGNWSAYSEPFVLFQNATVRFYAQAGAGPAKSAVRSAQYTFDRSPDNLDSDGDGVPDFVELGKGLDPILSGLDADGDGFSDLEEILKDYDPNDPDNPVDPDQPNEGDPTPGFEQKASFDWVVTPRPLDGTTGLDTTAQEEVVVSAYELSGGLVRIASTENQGTNPPAALLKNVPVQAGRPFLVVATEPHFDIETAHSDPRIGRELIRLMPQPQVKPVIVDHAFGAEGGDPAEEAEAWIETAQAAYLEAPHETYSIDLSVQDTLVALVFVRELEAIAEQRELSITNGLTVSGFRFADAGREPILPDVLPILESPYQDQEPYRLQSLFATVEGLVKTSTNAGVAALNQTAREVYRISSALNNDAPGVYLPALDALRQFVEEGSLPTNYTAVTTLSDSNLQSAQAGLDFIRSQLGSRPVLTVDARIRSDTFTAPCPVLDSAANPDQSVHLFDQSGRPFSFPSTFQLLPGSLLRVTGYSDLIVAGCPGLALEVLSAQLISVPGPSAGDLDGDLLEDGWEEQFPGLAGDPFGDADGDGYSNLQEMWEATDPLDGAAIPPVPAVPLQLPLVDLALLPDGQVQLEWEWPEPYQDRVDFAIRRTGDLRQPFQSLPSAGTPDVVRSGNRLSTRLPAPEPNARHEFFTLELRLW